ncbi:MAG: response regulator [Chromatiales bacterium]|nr:response regulator [Chromatiales bacterium]
MDLQELLVCLVEPSTVQRKLIKNFLTQLGLNKVQSVADGQSALQEIRNSRPDLVISALYLPDMTGTDLVHTMRAEEQIAEIAFLLISSETDLRVLDPIRQAGSIGILPKPFSLKDLHRALTATVEYYSEQSADFGGYDPENLRVLVVDDSPMARRHIRRVLGNMGIENFAEATNGAEAVTRLQESFFDLVVTDYNMPRMDGDQLTHFIREQSSQRSIPILMVTSEEDQSRLTAVAQAGVSAICDKPFEPARVRSLLGAMFNDQG